MIGTQASYERLTCETQKPPMTFSTPQPGNTLEIPAIAEGKTKKITMYYRLGSYNGTYYRKRCIDLQPIQPRPAQLEILSTITAHQARVKHTVVFLYGPPRSGKSMIGILLAERLNGTYCNTLKPWQPGDSFTDLYSDVEPTEKNPLIVAFDEIDTILPCVHAGIPPHKHIPTSISDKSGWNRWFDEIDRSIFPHCIVIMTSNTGPESIRALDPSYLREGRVNYILSLPLADKSHDE